MSNLMLTFLGKGSGWVGRSELVSSSCVCFCVFVVVPLL